MIKGEQTTGNASGRRSADSEESVIGKPVVTTDGDIIASVVDVDADALVVAPRKDLLKGYGSWLACPVRGHSTYTINHDAIARVDASKVVLKSPD